MITQINSEFRLSKRGRDEKGNTIMVYLTLYVQHDKQKYSLVQSSEEGVMFGKNSTIEKDLLYADLCKEAMLFVNKTFNKK